MSLKCTCDPQVPNRLKFKVLKKFGLFPPKKLFYNFMKQPLWLAGSSLPFWYWKLGEKVENWKLIIFVTITFCMIFVKMIASYWGQYCQRHADPRLSALIKDCFSVISQVWNFQPKFDQNSNSESRYSSVVTGACQYTIQWVILLLSQSHSSQVY